MSRASRTLQSVHVSTSSAPRSVRACTPSTGAGANAHAFSGMGFDESEGVQWRRHLSRWSAHPPRNPVALTR